MWREGNKRKGEGGTEERRIEGKMMQREETKRKEGEGEGSVRGRKGSVMERKGRGRGRRGRGV